MNTAFEFRQEFQTCEQIFSTHEKQNREMISLSFDYNYIGGICCYCYLSLISLNFKPSQRILIRAGKYSIIVLQTIHTQG